MLRNGLCLGDCLKNRFEPSQALAMTLSEESFSDAAVLSPNSGDVKRYLRGEAPALDPAGIPDGWSLMTVTGFPLGFLKKAGGRLKNHLDPSWRVTL